jgi:hypothetical protein
MQLIHDLGHYVELRQPSRETPLWRYVYGGKPKPFFHPLCTPAGHVVSAYEPGDHVWHRGLWYAIKFVNGENFWEEVDHPYGTQVTPVAPAVTHDEGGGVTVASKLAWTRPNGEVAAHEDRSFAYATIDQDAYAIDLRFSIRFAGEVTLDRTPFTTWGGYSGLTFRGNRNWTRTKLMFADGSTSDRPTPVVSTWCDLTGLIDGARDTQVGVAVFDHPANPRHPTPWYGGTGPGHYFNAAFLFHEPMTLKAGQPLAQQYRVIVHDHAISVDRMNALYAAWAS